MLSIKERFSDVIKGVLQASAHWMAVLLLLVGCNVYADAWTDSTGITFYYSISNKQATVTSVSSSAENVNIPSSLGSCPVVRIGEYAFFDCKFLADVVIPEGVQSIGRNAFYGRKWLSRVVIPSSVTNICEYAFYDCQQLQSIYISDMSAWCAISMGDRVFSKSFFLYVNEARVLDLVLPKEITNIGRCAFQRCALKSVTIPSGVTNIGEYAFGYCSGLTNAVIPLSVSRIERCAFYCCTSLVSISIPENIVTINDHVFHGCSSLTNIIITPHVESIGEYAFYGCSGVKSVKIPASVTNINYWAFECDKVEEIHIADLAQWCGFSRPGSSFGYSHKLFLDDQEVVDLLIPIGIARVGDGAFCGCSGLKSLTTPASTTNVGDSAFCFCKGLTNVTFATGLQSIGDYAFRRCDELEDVVIPEGVQRVGSEAFSQCASLLNVKIPSTLNRIEDYSFSSCCSITSVVIASGVQSIGECAFQKCSKLTAIHIPSSIKEIHVGSGLYVESAFAGCGELTRIALPRAEYKMSLLLPDSYMRLADAVVLSGERVHDYAFSECTNLKSVVVSSMVTNINRYAFSGCGTLTNLMFQGDAPVVEYGAFSGVSSKCRVTVYEDSLGWDDDGDGKWNGLTLCYVSRPLSVIDDLEAVVTGDKECGFLIKPSAGKTVVEVAIPDGLNPEKVTVEIGTNVTSVTSYGAKVKIVKGAHDITSYLDMPMADGMGAINLTKATVKESIVNEALDVSKGAIIDLNAETPSLTTSETKPGLTYTLKEGTSIRCMSPGDRTVGDGNVWTPTVTVKGGTSGFYSIDVSK